VRFWLSTAILDDGSRINEETNCVCSVNGEGSVGTGNYRDVDGVKTPFQWTIERRGQFTIRIEQAQQNVPIDETKFARPGSTTLEQTPPSEWRASNQVCWTGEDSRRDAGATIALLRLISREEKVMSTRNLVTSLILLVAGTLLASTGALKVTIKEYDIPTPRARPHDPAVSPDGALWVTEQMANKLGRLDPNTGQFREYPL